MKIAYVLRLRGDETRVRVRFACGHEALVDVRGKERPAAEQCWPCPQCTKTEDATVLDILRWKAEAESTATHGGHYQRARNLAFRVISPPDVRDDERDARVEAFRVAR